MLLSIDNYLFVIGGASGGEGGTDAMDLLNVNTDDGGTEESCSGRFPTKLWGAVGVTLGMSTYFKELQKNFQTVKIMSCAVKLIGQKPHVCGGLDSRFDAITSNCWAYDFNREQWSKTGR